MRVGNLPGLFITGILLCIFALGCGSGSPTSPGVASGGILTGDKVVSSSGNNCWALYDITVDPESGAVDIEPLRTAMFEANVTKFLHPPIAPIDLFGPQ